MGGDEGLSAAPEVLDPRPQLGDVDVPEVPIRRGLPEVGVEQLVPGDSLPYGLPLHGGLVESISGFGEMAPQRDTVSELNHPA